MDELINLIIELIYAFKYGQWFNKNKSFDKKIAKASFIEGNNAIDLKTIVNKQLSELLINGTGTPTYAYFEHKRNNWYKIFIVNNDKKFYCRLQDEIIEISELPEHYYIKLQ